jgi:hypothetical protein
MIANFAGGRVIALFLFSFILSSFKLYTTVESRPHLFLATVGISIGRWSPHLVLVVAIIGRIAVIIALPLGFPGFLFVVVDDGWGVDHVFHGLGFFLEVVLFVDVLDNLLVLALHVLDLLLQILELGVQGFYLLRASHVAGFAHGLGYRGI